MTKSTDLIVGRRYSFTSTFTVKRIIEGEVTVVFDGCKNDYASNLLINSVIEAATVELLPDPIVVGDKVKWKDPRGGQAEFEVITVVKDKCWLRVGCTDFVKSTSLLIKA